MEFRPTSKRILERRSVCRRRASALIITLAAVVLMAGLTLAFFSRASLNRQISSASVAQSRAESLAETVMCTLTGDLLDEIAQGSPDSDQDGMPGVTIDEVTIYHPYDVVASLPQEVGNDENFPNLLKRSAAGIPFWDAASIHATQDGPLRAVGSTSSAAARNRSGIGASRWNKALLLPNTPSVVPDWCLVLRGGILDGTPPSLNKLADQSPENEQAAVGRFAYMIYDTGGLLNVNVAGSLLPSTDTVYETGLLTAELETIPGILKPNDLLAWLNPKPALSWLTNPKNDFIGIRLDLQPGQRSFVRRQDLLRYAEAHPDVLTSGALQYLAVFSRQRNAPSWSPPANAVDMGGANGLDGSFAYKDNANQPSAINRNMANVRVIAPFVRPDGTQAMRGEPLLKQRFPLHRLGLVTASATTSSGPDIETFFGLTRATPNDSWSYRNGATSILTLEQVAQAGREPDFFELLKASILSGSLGKYSERDYSLVTKEFDQSKDAQIIQIGANLIDQYDEDNFPMSIQFSTLALVYGIENLPHIDHIYTTLFRPNRSDPEYPDLEGWLQFGLWNPHANAGDSTTPTKFRILGTDGKLYIEASNGPNYVSAQQDVTGKSIEFTSIGSTFAEPYLLVPSVSPPISGVAIDRVSDPAFLFTMGSQPSFATISSVTASSPCHLVGFYMGKLVDPITGASVKDNNITGKATDPKSLAYYHARSALGSGGRYPTFQLQYLDANDSWQTYEEVEAKGIYLDHWNQQGYLSCASWLNGQYGLNNWLKSDKGSGSGPLIGDGVAYGKAGLTSMDPRTKRAGMVRMIAYNNEPVIANATIRPSGKSRRLDTEGSSNFGYPSNPPDFTMWYAWTNNKFQPANLAQNIDVPNTSRVADLDGIVRRADGDESHQVSPLWQSPVSGAMRPYILNRPFRSVAEMGYAMRGDPWKSLNFFSADSADAALMDVFSITDKPVTAGRLSLNTRHGPVLASVLQGTAKADSGSASPPTLSESEAEDLADAILQERTTTPFLNVAELATRAGDHLADQMAIGPTGDSDGYIKIRRESVMRGLADVADTRTWNVMIDVIAQAGRYPPNPRNLDDFLVEGERRYWLHLAIDRYTGEVIAQEVEPVYE